MRAHLLIVVPLWFAGCAAPPEVREADRMANLELNRYVENTDALMIAAVKAYQTEAVAHVEYKLDVTLAALTMEDGTIDAAKAREAYAARDRALVAVGQEFNRFVAGMARAKVSLAHFRELKKAVDLLLEQEGIDPVRIDDLSELILGLGKEN